MKRSKLETYYHDQFGGPEASDDEPPPVRRPRAEPAPRPARRGGFGPFRLFRLALMLGPMALLGATFLMDCRGFAQGSWVPEILRGGACARRDLMSRTFSLDGQLRSVANSIR